MNNIENPMATNTLSANAEWLKEQSATALCKIIELVNNEGYPIEDVREFVETYGAKAMLEGFYEDWADLDESNDQDAIAEFVEEFGIENVKHFEDSYHGQYDDEADFAEAFYSDTESTQLPEWVVVDWQASFDRNLYYDFTVTSSGYVFANHF